MRIASLWSTDYRTFSCLYRITLNGDTVLSEINILDLESNKLTKHHANYRLCPDSVCPGAQCFVDSADEKTNSRKQPAVQPVA